MKCILKAFCVMTLSFSVFVNAQVNNGENAPAFSLKGDDGKTHSLAAHAGKYVVLEWFNEGCPYVKKYYNSGKMQELQKELSSKKIDGKDVVWFSVISSKKGTQGYLEPAAAQKLRKDKSIQSMAILFDNNGDIGRAYGAKTTPHMYIINPEGKVVYQGAIDDQPSANKKSLVGAKNYVTLAFNDLAAKKPVAVAMTTPYGCSVKY